MNPYHANVTPPLGRQCSSRQRRIWPPTALSSSRRTCLWDIIIADTPTKTTSKENPKCHLLHEREWCTAWLSLESLVPANCRVRAEQKVRSSARFRFDSHGQKVIAESSCVRPCRKLLPSRHLPSCPRSHGHRQSTSIAVRWSYHIGVRRAKSVRSWNLAVLTTAKKLNGVISDVCTWNSRRLVDYSGWKRYSLRSWLHWNITDARLSDVKSLYFFCDFFLLPISTRQDCLFVFTNNPRVLGVHLW